MGVTGPMKFKKSGPLFQKKRAPDFVATVCHPSTFIDLANIVLAN